MSSKGSASGGTDRCETYTARRRDRRWRDGQQSCPRAGRSAGDHIGRGRRSAAGASDARHRTDGLPYLRKPRRTDRRRRRCRDHRGADPSASRDRARRHRAQDSRAGREADRIHGRGGRGDRHGGASRRRHADGRPCRALQSGGRRHQAGDLGRGHSLDRDHPRRSVSAADVECRRGDRPRRARHRPDPLVHRIRYRRGAAATLQRGGRARGHRAACSSAPPPACSRISTPTG